MHLKLLKRVKFKCVDNLYTHFIQTLHRYWLTSTLCPNVIFILIKWSCILIYRIVRKVRMQSAICTYFYLDRTHRQKQNVDSCKHQSTAYATQHIDRWMYGMMNDAMVNEKVNGFCIKCKVILLNESNRFFSIFCWLQWNDINRTILNSMNNSSCSLVSIYFLCR